jgi:hypothetical protein
MVENIKVILGLSFILSFLTPNTNAQYEIDKHYAGPSLGLSFLGSTFQLGLNYEYAFTIKDFGTVGAGGIFRYWGYKESVFTSSRSISNVLIGGQFNYHFYVENKKIDPWAGVVLSYVSASITRNYLNNLQYSEPSYGGFWLGFHGGARYWITPTLALMGRIGFGTLSYGALELGVDFKF